MRLANILKEANRYEDVCEILKSIIDRIEDRTYPIDPYINEYGKRTVWRIDGYMILKEAIAFLKEIDSLHPVKTYDNFENLYHYVNTHSNMLLHNYANSLSHRHEPEIDIDEIRVWLVLSHIIVNLQLDGELEIPNGWKKF